MRTQFRCLIADTGRGCAPLLGLLPTSSLHAIDQRLEHVTNRRRVTTVYGYDDAGRVLSESRVVNGHTETMTHTYDGDGNELSRTDALNHTTAWTYYARGNRATETNALNQITRWTHNARNAMTLQYAPQPVGSTDPPRLVQENTYREAWGVLETSRNGLGEATQFTWDHGP